MKKIVRKSILFANIIIAILLVLTYISVHIDPGKFWPASFIGLAYPYTLLLNVFFIFFWLYFRKRYFIIPLMAILLGWNYLSSYIQLNKKSDDVPPSAFKILSYNLRMINLYSHSKNTEQRERILAFIATEDPDIICFQEYYSTLKNKYSPPSVFQSYYNNRNSFIEKANKKMNYGLSIFSKFDIINKQRIDFKNSLNFSIFADIVNQNDTLRIYNIHLQSIRFQEGEYQLMDSLQFFYNENQIKQLLNISSKLKYAFIKRSEQAEMLAESIHNSPYPVIVCGDFNDTPVSYTYRLLRNNLEDAFIHSGNGFGNTYIGKFPSFRIDYILHSKELNSYNYKKPNIKHSDHYPVICEISH